MPVVNIPGKLRFFLYPLAAIALIVVSYAVDKPWVGDGEVRLVTGLAGLLNLLAAAKTDLHESNVYELEGQVAHTGRVEGTVSPQGAIPGHVDNPTNHDA